MTPNFSIFRSLALLAAIVYWVALAVGTHWPRITLPFDGAGGIDKVLHFSAFAGLAFLLALAVRQWRPLGLLQYLLLAAALLIYGAIDEATQLLVPGRSCELADWLADAAGAVAGLATFAVAERLWFLATPNSGDFAADAQEGAR
jgi:hypothetical protein